MSAYVRACPARVYEIITSGANKILNSAGSETYTINLAESAKIASKMGGTSCKSCCSTTWSYTLSATATLLEYDTAKIVHIHNKKVGIMNRLVQLVIVGYIVG